MTRPGKTRTTMAQRELDTDVYTLAKERCRHIFETFDHVGVMFSGGKDSTATLMVALEVLHEEPAYARHLPLRVIFYDEEAIPTETVDYVRRISQRDDVALEWYCLPVKHRNACSRTSPWWWPWAPEDREKWCRPMPPEARTELEGFPLDPPEARLTIPAANGLFAPPRLGNVALMMGIRAQESLTRRRAVTRLSKQGTNYLTKFDEGTSKGNLWKAYPIYDWTHEDVWTAPALNGWDYNRAYDLLEMAGISAGMQRCSPAFGEEPLQKIHTYASCFPDVWAKMSERVPGISAASRYALTELYSYHGRPEKPEGMPWGEFVLHYLDRYNPADKRMIARRIREEIQAHYSITHHPLVYKAPHPDTGRSWDFLLMLAMRGDFKGRKQAGGRILTMPDGTGRAEPRYWRRYITELEAIIEAGTFDELGHPRPAPRNPRALLPDYAKDALNGEQD